MPTSEFQVHQTLLYVNQTLNLGDSVQSPLKYLTMQVQPGGLALACVGSQSVLWYAAPGTKSVTLLGNCLSIVTSNGAQTIPFPFQNAAALEVQDDGEIVVYGSVPDQFVILYNIFSDSVLVSETALLSLDEAFINVQAKFNVLRESVRPALREGPPDRRNVKESGIPGPPDPAESSDKAKGGKKVA